MDIKHQNKLFMGNIYYLLMLMVSIISIITVLINYDTNYKLLWLLPTFFIFGHLMLWLFYTNIFIGVGSIFIHGFYFFRMSLLPIIISIGSYSSNTSIFYFADKINTAIFLMGYEYLCVIFYMIWFLKIRKKRQISKNIMSIFYVESNNYKNIMEYRSKTKKHSLKFKVIVFALIVFTGTVIIFIPQLKYYFQLFFLSEEMYSARTNIRKEVVQNVVGVIYYPFKIAIELVRIVLPIILINKIYYSNKKITTKLLLSFIIMFFVMMISTGEQVTAIKIVIMIFIIMINMYLKHLKAFLPGVYVSIGIAIFYGLFIKTSISSLSRFASVMQAYFNGISDVALGISLPSNYSYILGDVLKGIPLLSTFFKDFLTSNQVYNITSDYISAGSQIIPFISAAYLYVGFIFAPAFVVALAYMALVMDNKYRATNNFISKYFYGYVGLTLAMMPHMYSPQIFIGSFFAQQIPLLLLANFENKRFKNVTQSYM